MRRRTGETEEELENEAEEGPPVNGDLGAILMGVQDSAGNAALAGLVAQVESGQVPPESLLPGGKPPTRTPTASGRGSRTAPPTSRSPSGSRTPRRTRGRSASRAS